MKEIHKKFIGNKKAVDAPFAIVIVAIIIIAGIAFYVTSGGSTPYWETDNEFGMWEDELYIEFADGTTQSLKLIEEGRDMPFTVKYNNKEIVSMGLMIRATPTGTGYDGAELIYSNSFGAGKVIKSSGGVVLYDATSKLSDGTTKKCPIDTSTAILTTGLDLQHIMNDNPSRYPNGAYVITFTPKGTVKYRGYPDGGDTWKTASLPPPRIAFVKVAGASSSTPPGTILEITITLSSEITAR